MLCVRDLQDSLVLAVFHQLLETLGGVMETCFKAGDAVVSWCSNNCFLYVLVKYCQLSFCYSQRGQKNTQVLC